MRRAAVFAGICAAILFWAMNVGATIFGTVQGTVLDPQHMPAPGATVTLKAVNSDFMEAQTSGDHGQFLFTAVPLGDYTVTVSLQGFQTQQQKVMVPSDQTINVTFTMAVAGVQESVVVTAAPTATPSTSVTPTTTVDREDIQNTPGADRTDSVAAITDYTPGAYVVHDMLHIRGGHQFNWLIDGVPVPNTNIAVNVGPQIDPNDLDYIEVQRGSYDAEYGDRTYGVFNAVPRTGFERDNECDLLLTYGNYQQSNDQINCGSHTQKFAYYISFNGNTTELGLQTPTAADDHDGADGYGGFSTLVYNLTPHDQLRLVLSLRQDNFQIPTPPTLDITQPNLYVPEELAITPYPGAYQDDTQLEQDGLVSFSWVHSFVHDGLLTVSPFYHYNAANYNSSPLDYPNAITSHQANHYLGGQITAGATVARNSLQAGAYGFWQRDNQLFAVDFTDGSNPPLFDQELIHGGVAAFWVTDKYQPTNWLTLSAGLRQTHFASPDVSENATSPRVGAAIRVPKVDWVFDAFWGQFYQAPPLITLSGPLLGFVNTCTGGMGSTPCMENPQQFTPLHGERDTELQAGVNIPVKSWNLHIDTFRTDISNFLDHGNINYSFDGMTVPTNLFVPLTTQYALVRAWELTLKSPLIWKRVQGHLAYSNQVALFRGAITGGLSDLSYVANWFPLDHDQRNTLNFGFSVLLPKQFTVGGNFYYGSGFQNGLYEPDTTYTPPAPLYLNPNSSLDLSVSKSFREDRYRLSVAALNVYNDHLLIDDSLTFGGFHYNYPFEIYGEFRWRFHY